MAKSPFSVKTYIPSLSFSVPYAVRNSLPYLNTRVQQAQAIGQLNLGKEYIDPNQYTQNQQAQKGNKNTTGHNIFHDILGVLNIPTAIVEGAIGGIGQAIHQGDASDVGSTIARAITSQFNSQTPYSGFNMWQDIVGNTFKQWEPWQKAILGIGTDLAMNIPADILTGGAALGVQATSKLLGINKVLEGLKNGIADFATTSKLNSLKDINPEAYTHFLQAQNEGNLKYLDMKPKLSKVVGGLKTTGHVLGAFFVPGYGWSKTLKAGWAKIINQNKASAKNFQHTLNKYVMNQQGFSKDFLDNISKLKPEEQAEIKKDLLTKTIANTKIQNQLSKHSQDIEEGVQKASIENKSLKEKQKKELSKAFLTTTKNEVEKSAKKEKIKAIQEEHAKNPGKDINEVRRSLEEEKAPKIEALQKEEAANNEAFHNKWKNHLNNAFTNSIDRNDVWVKKVLGKDLDDLDKATADGNQVESQILTKKILNKIVVETVHKNSEEARRKPIVAALRKVMDDFHSQNKGNIDAQLKDVFPMTDEGNKDFAYLNKFLNDLNLPPAVKESFKDIAMNRVEEKFLRTNKPPKELSDEEKADPKKVEAYDKKLKDFNDRLEEYRKEQSDIFDNEASRTAKTGSLYRWDLKAPDIQNLTRHLNIMTQVIHAPESINFISTLDSISDDALFNLDYTVKKMLSTPKTGGEEDSLISAIEKGERYKGKNIFNKEGYLTTTNITKAQEDVLNGKIFNRMDDETIGQIDAIFRKETTKELRNNAFDEFIKSNKTYSEKELRSVGKVLETRYAKDLAELRDKSMAINELTKVINNMSKSLEQLQTKLILENPERDISYITGKEVSVFEPNSKSVTTFKPTTGPAFEQEISDEAYRQSLKTQYDDLQQKLKEATAKQIELQKNLLKTSQDAIKVSDEDLVKAEKDYKDTASQLNDVIKQKSDEYEKLKAAQDEEFKKNINVDNIPEVVQQKAKSNNLTNLSAFLAGEVPLKDGYDITSLGVAFRRSENFTNNSRNALVKTIKASDDDITRLEEQAKELPWKDGEKAIDNTRGFEKGLFANFPGLEDVAKKYGQKWTNLLDNLKVVYNPGKMIKAQEEEFKSILKDIEKAIPSKAPSVPKTVKSLLIKNTFKDNYAKQLYFQDTFKKLTEGDKDLTDKFQNLLRETKGQTIKIDENGKPIMLDAVQKFIKEQINPRNNVVVKKIKTEADKNLAKIKPPKLIKPEQSEEVKVLKLKLKENSKKITQAKANFAKSQREASRQAIVNAKESAKTNPEFQALMKERKEITLQIEDLLQPNYLELRDFRDDRINHLFDMGNEAANAIAESSNRASQLRDSLSQELSPEDRETLKDEAMQSFVEKNPTIAALMYYRNLINKHNNRKWLYPQDEMPNILTQHPNVVAGANEVKKMANISQASIGATLGDIKSTYMNPMGSYFPHMVTPIQKPTIEDIETQLGKNSIMDDVNNLQEAQKKAANAVNATSPSQIFQQRSTATTYISPNNWNHLVEFLTEGGVAPTTFLGMNTDVAQVMHSFLKGPYKTFDGMTKMAWSVKNQLLRVASLKERKKAYTMSVFKQKKVIDKAAGKGTALKYSARINAASDMPSLIRVMSLIRQEGHLKELNYMKTRMKNMKFLGREDFNMMVKKCLSNSTIFRDANMKKEVIDNAEEMDWDSKEFENWLQETPDQEVANKANVSGSGVKDFFNHIKNMMIEYNRARLKTTGWDDPMVMIDSQMEQHIKDTYSGTQEGLLGSLSRAVDKIMGTWKGLTLMTPGYFIRNWLGNQLNGLAKFGANPTHWANYQKENYNTIKGVFAARRVYNDKKLATELFNSYEFTHLAFSKTVGFDEKGWQALANRFWKENERENVMKVFELAHQGVGDINTENLDRQYAQLNNINGVNPLTKIMTWVGDKHAALQNYIDLGSRGGAYFTAKKYAQYYLSDKGNLVDTGKMFKDWDEANTELSSVDDLRNRAGAFAKLVHFDYHNLTPFETKYMSRIIPFYTWQRKNMEFQLRNSFLHPSSATTWSRIASDISQSLGMNPTNTPDIMAEFGYIPVFKSDNKISLFKFIAPQDDMYAILSPNVISRINPLFSATISTITGHDMVTGNAVSDYTSGGLIPTPLKELVNNLVYLAHPNGNISADPNSPFNSSIYKHLIQPIAGEFTFRPGLIAAAATGHMNYYSNSIVSGYDINKVIMDHYKEWLKYVQDQLLYAHFSRFYKPTLGTSSEFARNGIFNPPNTVWG